MTEVHVPITIIQHYIRIYEGQFIVLNIVLSYSFVLFSIKATVRRVYNCQEEHHFIIFCCVCRLSYFFMSFFCLCKKKNKMYSRTAELISCVFVCFCIKCLKMCIDYVFFLSKEKYNSEKQKCLIGSQFIFLYNLSVIS